MAVPAVTDARLPYRIRDVVRKSPAGKERTFHALRPAGAERGSPKGRGPDRAGSPAGRLRFSRQPSAERLLIAPSLSAAMRDDSRTWDRLAGGRVCQRRVRVDGA